ncbi:MAG: cyclic nucleotide-binding domain-containing protein [Magnetococcales bacterium]|nr:cyclic nucleotide-binding domain-containing protein [Magnetococcales bacterium]MBF0150638.1 cyclic nucleotide-binding domain-containing protein [Magnetococcales bacterium]MBF0173549.1 cyclic nucleotide-binding domain-containing protein [Magnetococcales bacterium]MBF0347971.1 cyclic nucleotide-binding domain-containing protein [Magnetococcales bacterium]MBF0630455.1 cyclic nucleotide-binding domain-containing protein [Magnetococcales bacterium]
MDRQTLLSKIATIEFFNDFSDAERAWFCDNELFCFYQDGKKIIVEGAQDRTFYVLIDGTVLVTKNAVPDEILAQLGPGSVFGEIAHFARQQRATNVLAQGRVLVFRLEHDLFKKLPAEAKLKINHQAMAILMHRLESKKNS